MGSASLAAGLLLPWALGIAALLATRARERPLDAPGELAWLLGAGYLAGAILLTLWMRALSLAGIRFGIASIGAPLLLATAACAWMAWRRDGARAMLEAARHACRVPADIGGVLRWLWWTLLAWLALRYVLLALEVSLRPLYPWDAWIAWATKARVWFEQGRMVPFVDATAWLAGDGSAWFDAEPRNPATLPLLQVWSCLALGRWDDALMNWPWWQMAAALALVVYGGLRRLGTGACTAILGAWFVASLPLANVHVALAGYADLPLAAYYAAAVLALLHWTRSRDARSLVAAALLALACPLVKSAGAWWALTLLPGLLVVAMPRNGRKLAAAIFGLLVFALAVLAQTNLVVGGRSLHLEFAPAWASLVDGFLIVGTWNLLWYGAAVAVVLARGRLLQPPLLPLSTIVAFGMLLLFVVLAFPGVAAFVTDPPTLSRAALHLAPVLVVFMTLAFDAFAAQWREAHPPPVAPPTPASADAAPASAEAPAAGSATAPTA